MVDHHALVKKHRPRLLALACLASLGCGSSAPKELPAKAERLEGFDVDVDVRASSYRDGELAVEALAKNHEASSLIGLSVEVSARDKDGKALHAIDLDAVGMHASISVLEPGFDVPIHVREKLSGAPASIEVRVTRAERFADAPDAPQTLTVGSANGADASGLEVVTFGHFRVDSMGDPGSVPFHAMLGIRNVGHSTVKRLDYGIVLSDERGRDVDRVPIVHVFEPPLKPGDAILESVSANARAYAKVSIDVRSVTRE